jgi:hypothetical protein
MIEKDFQDSFSPWGERVEEETFKTTSKTTSLIA